MNTPLLEVRGLSKAFGRLQAVKDMSFAIAEGEIVGVIGPNGAGKSTLINLITRVPYTPDAGEIFLAGKPIHGMSARRILRHGLARTFQAESVFQTLAPDENVALAAHYGRRGRITRSERSRAVAEALELVRYSGGFTMQSEQLPLIEKKKLMLASAIAANPLVLCMDEPASGLIDREQDELAEIILDIRRSGVALLIIEHVLPLMSKVADRLLVMSSGELLTDGEPQAVLSSPEVIEIYIGESIAPSA